jgi:hypothetical protein
MFSFQYCANELAVKRHIVFGVSGNIALVREKKRKPVIRLYDLGYIPIELGKPAINSVAAEMRKTNLFLRMGPTATGGSQQRILHFCQN